MGNPMKIRAKTDGQITDVKILMSHVMETGLRKNEQGELIPARFIQFVTVTYQDRTVLHAQWGPAVSANPYLAFKFEGGQKGDKLQVKWTDNTGDSRADEVAIA
jgi:sulfur-oxidizing protein SoxZ